MEPTKKVDGLSNNFLIPDADSQLPLPKELMDYIFSTLSESEMKDVVTTNKFWNNKSLEYVKNEQYLPLKSLAGWLSVNLSEEYQDQKDALQSTFNDTSIFKSENLPDVKSSVYDLEKKILDILMGLDELEFLKLNLKFNSENKLPQFEHLFDLIPVYKEIERIEKFLPLTDKETALVSGTSLGKLVAFGNLSKALALIKAIATTPNKQATISSIVLQLNNRYLHLRETNRYNGQQHFDDAVKIMNLLSMKKPSEFYNLHMFEYKEEFNIKQLVSLCIQLFSNDRLDKAIELADKFSEKDFILAQMAISQASDDRKAGMDNTKALEIIEKISNPNTKEYALYDIQTLGIFNFLGSTNPGLLGSENPGLRGR